MLWVALKPVQQRHMVVSVVRTGEIVRMLVWRVGSVGVRPVPQKVRVRCIVPRVRRMLALRTINILAAIMLSFGHVLSGSLA
jgi:hypothetical protein